MYDLDLKMLLSKRKEIRFMHYEIHLDKLCDMQMAANAWLALQPIRKRKIGNKITKIQLDTERRFW